MLVTYFYHKVTGNPGTGLTATVTLVNANNDKKILDNVPLTELTSMGGAYVYNYNIDTEIDYIAYFSCTDPNYLPKVDKMYIPKQVGGYLGGNKSSQYDFNAQDRDYIKKIYEKVKELKNAEEIDLSPIIDKIEEIEIPEIEIEEFPEDIKNKIDKITQYIDQEQAEKEKEEKEKEQERKREEEAEKKEIQAIVQAIKEVEKEQEMEIKKALKQIDQEHEENIIKALNSL